MIIELSGIMLMSPPPGEGGGGGSILGMLLPFIAIIAIMYFLMIRPQQKRAKEHQKMLEGIRKGDKVVTSSGIHGTVSDVEEKTFIVQIAENVKIKVEKSAVAQRN